MKDFWLGKVDSHIFYLMAIGILFPFPIYLPLLLCGVTYILWTKSSSMLELGTSQKWIVIFVIYTFIVSMVSQNVLGMIFPFILIIGMIYYSHYRDWLDGQKYLITLMIFTLGSIPVALMNFFSYLNYALHMETEFLYPLQETDLQFRAEGTFGNANLYGAFCMFAIMIALYLMTKEKRLSMKSVYLLSIFLNGMSILLTASRMLLPTLAIGLAWFIFFGNRKYIKATFVLIALAVLFFLNNPKILPRFETTDLAILDRFKLWENGWEVFKSSPFFGKGTFSFLIYHWFKEGYYRTHSHQLLIELLASYGIVGLGLIFACLKEYFNMLKEMYKNYQYAEEFALVSSLILILLVHGTFDIALGIQPTFIFLSVVVAPLPVLQEASAIKLDEVFLNQDMQAVKIISNKPFE